MSESAHVTGIESIKALDAPRHCRIPALNALIHSAGTAVPENSLDGKNFQATDNATINAKRNFSNNLTTS